jgi:glycosyltransferase involved in cell wall biosynthesis
MRREFLRPEPGDPRISNGTVVGIDASRNRSGGAKAHLVGILCDCDPLAHGVRQVHVWSYKSLLDALPDVSWLIKHNPPELERPLLRQVWWQYRRLPQEARDAGCDVLLNTDAGTVCPFRPAVVMSRDMLSYEPGEMRRYGLSRARLRLIALRFLQTRSLARADGAIFLTQYAARVIQGFTGKLGNVSVIPHGVGAAFRQMPARGSVPGGRREIRCMYVSNAAMYKHQWTVVKAIGALRSRGHDISLALVGGGSGPAQRLLDREIAAVDPAGDFVRCEGAVRHADIPAQLASADLFIFASSCENMPNTLVEAMASGLPIACSDRGPMPEILRDGGVYFDPEDATSIASAVESLLVNPELCTSVAARAKALSEQYSWLRCGSETWAFLRAVAGHSPGLARPSISQ